MQFCIVVASGGWIVDMNTCIEIKREEWMRVSGWQTKIGREREIGGGIRQKDKKAQRQKDKKAQRQKDKKAQKQKDKKAQRQKDKKVGCRQTKIGRGGSA